MEDRRRAACSKACRGGQSQFATARSINPHLREIRANIAASAGIRGDIARAAAELNVARSLSRDDRYSSLAKLCAVENFGVQKIRALFEATYFDGLRKAGMPEECIP